MPFTIPAALCLRALPWGKPLSIHEHVQNACLKALPDSFSKL